VVQLVEALCYKPERRSRVWFLMLPLEFFIDVILLATLWPWELTQPPTEMRTRNISWGVKAAGAYGWQPDRLQVLIILKSGNLNLLEPSGPIHGLLFQDNRNKHDRWISGCTAEVTEPASPIPTYNLCSPLWHFLSKKEHSSMRGCYPYSQPPKLQQHSLWIG
jgi:hypothetical protein